MSLFVGLFERFNYQQLFGGGFVPVELKVRCVELNLQFNKIKKMEAILLKA